MDRSSFRSRSMGRGILLGITVAFVTAAVPRTASCDIRAEVEGLKAHVRQTFAERHLDLSGQDIDSVVDEFVERRERGERGAQISTWLQRRLLELTLDFAPTSAAHDPTVRYSLPFDTRIPRLVSQGAGGKYSHTGRDYYSFDFTMPLGTEVRAARRGRVGQVIDGFKERNLTLEDGWKANVVVVVHNDGTWATYAHLAPGIPVRTGQLVKRRELLGFSDQTGFAISPHLHFSVAKRSMVSGFETVRIRFKKGRKESFIPEPGRLYFTRREFPERLTVFVGDRPLEGAIPTPVPTDVAVALRVELDAPGRSSVDVTQRPETRFHAISPWNLSIGENGTVRFGMVPGWEFDLGLSRELAYLTVEHRDEVSGHRIFSDSVFSLKSEELGGD